MNTQAQSLLVDLIQETLSPDGLYSSYVFEKDYIEGVLGIQIPLNESYPYSNELRIRILEEEGKIRGFFSSLKQAAKGGWEIAMTMREACKDKASIEQYTKMAINQMKPKMKQCISWLEYVKEIDEKVATPPEMKEGSRKVIRRVYTELLKVLPTLDSKVESADGWRKVVWSTMALVAVEFVHSKIQSVGLDVLEDAIDEFNVVAKEQGVDLIKKGSVKSESRVILTKLILESGEAAKKAWVALMTLVKKWGDGLLKMILKTATVQFVKAKISGGIANVISWFETAVESIEFAINTLKPIALKFRDWSANKAQEIKKALSGEEDPTVSGSAAKAAKAASKPIKFENRNRSVILRQLIKEILEQESSSLPKGEWVLLQPGDKRRESIKYSLYDMVCQTYAATEAGYHFKICNPQDLDRYTYWVVQDLDDDPEADVAILGKPDIAGQKMGAAANDGTPAASSAYKNKSAELRGGGAIGGVGNWWGEVSGKPAYAMLKRGAKAVEDEAKVAQLLSGDDYIFHGEHPDPNAPPLFKSAKGWYTKKFGSKSSTKIILGNPA